ncbi:uncharacterized protein LOC122394879 [Colletes gigas]|uniref:uncharacterized protein LOC122394879 n=1 Tax=Colletes gigas TaxID=935657 RepID=UPI001C9A9019|nr:uncharacterized protein LOC122394879 [Colletes gigas]
MTAIKSATGERFIVRNARTFETSGTKASTRNRSCLDTSSPLWYSYLPPYLSLLNRNTIAHKIRPGHFAGHYVNEPAATRNFVFADTHAANPRPVARATRIMLETKKPTCVS